MKDLVRNGFARNKPAVLVQKSRDVVDGMTANVAYFPSPVPTLAELQATTDDLVKANVDASAGDRIMIAIRDQLFNKLVGMLQQEGLYVNLCANGDRTIARRSGFELKDEGAPRKLEPLPAPVVRLMPERGKLEGRVSYSGPANQFTWYISDDPSKPITQWESHDGEGASFIFENCVPGKTYYVCVQAFGTRRQRSVSPVTTIIA